MEPFQVYLGRKSNFIQKTIAKREGKKLITLQRMHITTERLKST